MSDPKAREAFFATLWQDFIRIAPQAAQLHSAFEAAGEVVHNDHVAFRTFDRSPISLEALQPLILDLGYQLLDEYHFEDKHLRARAYLCPGSPRIFLSELLVDALSAPARAVIESAVAAIDPSQTRTSAVFHAGRLWPAIRFADYERIADESEYAAWLLALGLRPNHFTVSVAELTRLRTLQAVLGFVEKNGYAINAAGGRIKGSASVHLEQGSTLADRMFVPFADGEHVIPTCYYEFALRYPMTNGQLYQGFVTSSADKIFESTHRAP